MKSITIIKANGDKVPFEIRKLIASLQKSGASYKTAKRIAGKIASTLSEGSHTKEIYKKAFALLKKEEQPQAARYQLKKGIQDLGPSGFPFEKYLSEIIKFDGYEVQTDKIVPGHCINHEIDVIAKKDNNQFLIECKYHSQPGYKCNVKIPLYIHARFLDILKYREALKEHNNTFHQAWIATNTKFTRDAITYGNCAGMYLLSWNYPKNDSLKDRVDASGLYPLTCLTTLSSGEKQALLDKLIVLGRDICNDPNVLLKIGVSKKRLKKVLAEATALCKI